ncbi:D-alanyl-D-alanine carboxypeptidase [Candidatus Saccharibacteria bacterium]|nr:D-alanyl-D-alanine carboxypeptidase [Candidatus Saccharibacteria bacterium]MCA9328813.1 D-alanyl-D-alanine carboxypeptidase [Candidatus Saccharibacteria bacterium]
MRTKHYRINERVNSRRIWHKLLLAPLVAVALLLASYTKFPINNKNVEQPLNQNTFQQSVTKIEDVTEEDKPREISLPINWPEYGHAAYAVPEEKMISVHDADDEAVPIASLSKLITALAVLDKYPLEVGDEGPLIRMSEADAALVGYYAQKSGTTTLVLAGQEISQYQALQSILMVSSNNMADSLAIWSFGSIEEYVDYANEMLRELGLEDTIVADDASGYSPNTISTASNMTKIGYLFMTNPVLRQITQQKSAKIPVAGTIYNYNDYFNDEGIYGIKFGNTDEAGKCFIVASIRETIDKKEELSISVVLGANSYDSVAKDAKSVLLAGNQAHDTLKENP